MTANPADPAPGTRVRKRSVVIAGHATSISLEDAFWRRLRKIARRRGVSVNRLVAEIDRGRTDQAGGNLSSAIRVFVLEEADAGPRPSRRPSASSG